MKGLHQIKITITITIYIIENTHKYLYFERKHSNSVLNTIHTEFVNNTWFYFYIYSHYINPLSLFNVYIININKNSELKLAFSPTLKYDI